MVHCPRCALKKIRKGKKMVPDEVEMREGMNLVTCPKCDFQCRSNDVNINEQQPHYELPSAPFMIQ